MTRDERGEKIDALNSWCADHPCNPIECRIYDDCHRYPGAWSDQSDEVIEKVYKAIWEGNVDIDTVFEALWEGKDLKKEEAENRLQQAEEQLGMEIHLDKDQKAKADSGKAQISLVPMEIVWAIAWIRMYGNRKYGDPENWKTVGPKRYRDALMRHLLHYISDPESVDEESGYPHLWHAACNMAFLIHMDYGPMAYFDWNEEQWKKVMEDGHE